MSSVGRLGRKSFMSQLRSIPRDVVQFGPSLSAPGDCHASYSLGEINESQGSKAELVRCSEGST